MRVHKNERETELYRLSDLADYEVADRDPDVRGWEVVSADKKVGTVDELIVDPDDMKVRYLDILIKEDIYEAGTDNRHLLIPIDTAQFDSKEYIVRVNDIETITL